MPDYRVFTVAFKRQVSEEFLAGASLHALSRKHEVARNLIGNLAHVRAGDEIKFVITGRQDYAWARDMIAEHALDKKGLPILFSPVWGELEAAALAGWVIEDGLPVRVHLQLHKYIWGGEAKGV